MLVLFFSMSAEDALPEYVMTAPSISSPFLTHHPSVKESVISALMSLELSAKTKVRIG